MDYSIHTAILNYTHNLLTAKFQTTNSPLVSANLVAVNDQQLSDKERQTSRLLHQEGVYVKKGYFI